jgi:hypothetical protein
MITIEMEVSSELKRLLSQEHSKNVDRAIKKTCNTLGDNIIDKIQEPGFAPRDTGEFADSHYSRYNDKETVILARKKAKNGTPLSHYIIGGHRVLTTAKSRKWWFWHLKNNLGGSYTRKTNGPPGYVPPNNYHERAVNAVSFNSVMKIIEGELLH